MGEYSVAMQSPYAIVAHRGAVDYAPPHSYAAYQKAAELGADVIEVDVRLTRDGVPVLLHPFYLDGPSGSDAIFTHDFAEVRRTHPDLLRLEELLEAFAGRVGLEIEVKGPEREAPSIVAQALRPYRSAWPSIWVTFQDVGLLSGFGSACPEVTRVFNNPKFEPWMTTAVREHVAAERARAAGVRGVQLHRGELDALLVQRLRARGLTLRAWDVNDEEGLQTAATLGISRVCTDRLDLALRVRRELQAAGRNP